MARRSLLVASLALAVAGCIDTPPEVMTTTSDPGESTSTTSVLPTTGGPTTPPQETSAGTMGMTGAGTTGSVDTTEGSVDTTNGTSSSGSSSSSSDGPPPECQIDDDCGSNEVCDAMGTCIAACNPWGMGTYDYCLNDWGGFDAPGLCGPNHFCVRYGGPIQATSCMFQGCTSPCDCPGPPATGDATVSCAEITNGGQNECYLSCGNGEVCPDGMMCYPGTSDSYCMTPTPDTLPMYGNCGALGAMCDNGECSTADVGGDIYTVCVTLCEGMGVGVCDAPPPGGTAACAGVIFPPNGADCYLSCESSADCPGGMTCIYFGGTEETLCMWPPL